MVYYNLLQFIIIYYNLLHIINKNIYINNILLIYYE